MSDEITRLRRDKDHAYAERDMLLASLVRCWVALGVDCWIGRHQPDDDPSWDPEWRTVIFARLPSGQVSWHVHVDEVRWFGSLPTRDEQWDGHTTVEKYARLSSFDPSLRLENMRRLVATECDELRVCIGKIRQICESIRR